MSTDARTHEMLELYRSLAKAQSALLDCHRTGQIRYSEPLLLAIVNIKIQLRAVGEIV